LSADPAAVGTSLAAGTTPDVATTEVVPGGYPLTWLTSLYTEGGRFSPDQANSMAATIRYIVTDGQDAIVTDGGVAMSDALVAKALKGADAVVAANCTQPGFEVATGGPSVFEPATPKVQAIAAMKHCQAVPPPPATTATSVAATTTTTAATTTTSNASTTTAVTTAPTVVGSEAPVVTSRSSSGNTPSAVRPAPSRTVAVTVPISESTTNTSAPASVSATTTTTSVAPSGAGRLVRGRPLSALPMPRPADGSSGFKKLGTLMLGSALFLFGRKLYLVRRVLE
jgi:hypothetical protein